MKTVIFLSMLLVLLYGCSSSKLENQDPTKWKHFRIDATTSDDSVFYRVQKSFGIEPVLPLIIICVNISDKDKSKHTITIGDDSDPTSFSIPWSGINKKDQDALINWTGINKYNLEKKMPIHQYPKQEQKEIYIFLKDVDKELVSRIQNVFSITSPIEADFIYIDLRNKDKELHTICFINNPDDMKKPETKIYSWSRVSEEDQKALLNIYNNK